MSEIRLDKVTKTFGASSFWAPSASGSSRAYSDYQDKAYVERVSSQNRQVGSTGDPVKALDDLSLTIRDGETMAVVGPSGCGKSTLLRVVAGLEDAESGHVYYDDQIMDDVSPKDRGIGMVFQSYALYPHMEGEGNLGFFFKVRKRPSEEMMERIRITSEMMGIGFKQLLDRKPGTLSGGQQQRVAIARCLVRDPKLFLFDEPLSNLDAKLRTSTRIEIRRLLQRFHITAIYVTHDQTEAITLGDRIAVMRDGKIEQLGTYHEITESPANSFVAGFLGLPPMNLLPDWTVTSDGHLESDMGYVRVPEELAGSVTPGQHVTLGFRSESAAVIPEEDDAPESGLVIPGEVINCEPDFARHQQTVNVQAGSLIFGVRTDIDQVLRSGWQVRVVVPDEAAYLFDGESEARIVAAEGVSEG